MEYVLSKYLASEWEKAEGMMCAKGLLQDAIKDL